MGETGCGRMKVDEGRSIRKLLRYGGLNKDGSEGSCRGVGGFEIEVELIALLL